MKSAFQGLLFPAPPRDASVRVGPAGWNYKDWEGVVYPKGVGKSFDPIAYLAEFFDCIEINSSFYAPPRPRDVASWARRVQNNPRFRFTAKAWQKLTHDRDEGTEASINSDCDVVRRAMGPLAEAGVLGSLLLQFPWSYRYAGDNLEYLEKLFRRLSGLPLAIEVRHGSWNQESFYSFLQSQGVAFCNVDQPVIGDSLGPSGRATAKLGYLRLHGRNYGTWFEKDAGRDARYDYLYSETEVKEISRHIDSIQQSTEETYVITNNHFRGQALVNAIEILEELDTDPPGVPPALAAAYPRLRRIGAGDRP
jgi:uncharacterized protein YecE (DUF72 family)